MQQKRIHMEMTVLISLSYTLYQLASFAQYLNMLSCWHFNSDNEVKSNEEKQSPSWCGSVWETSCSYQLLMLYKSLHLNTVHWPCKTNLDYTVQFNRLYLFQGFGLNIQMHTVISGTIALVQLHILGSLGTLINKITF